MKLIKKIQEDGMFAVADSFNKTMDESRPLHDVIRGMKWDQAVRALVARGLTEYQVYLIQEAKWGEVTNSHPKATKLILGLAPDPMWPNQHTNAIRTLLQRHIAYASSEYYLSERGEELWMALNTIYTNVKSSTPAKDTDNLDVDLSRDGIVKTCSKLWWIWTNKELIEQQAKQKQLDEFTAGHATIEEAVQMIATSEQRVARKLLEQVPEKAQVYWTEAEQRKQNDIYWMSPNAFWLNPRGALAAPTPAPDWWVEPEDYRSMTARRLAAVTDDTVDLSLLPPPVDTTKARQDAVVAQIAAERKQLDVELNKMNLGRLSNEDLQAMLRMGNDEPTDSQQKLATWYGYFARDNRSNLVYALRTNEEVIQWLKTFENIPHTIAGQGSISYGELLRLYEKQQRAKTPEECLDDIIAYLDNLDGPDTDAYEQFVETIGSDGKVKRKRIETGAPKRNKIVEQQDGFCLVEINNLVRGFETRLEAEVYLAEYHTDMMHQKAREAQKTRTMMGLDSDTFVPIIYGDKDLGGPRKPNKSSK